MSEALWLPVPWVGFPRGSPVLLLQLNCVPAKFLLRPWTQHLRM